MALNNYESRKDTVYFPTLKQLYIVLPIVLLGLLYDWWKCIFLLLHVKESQQTVVSKCRITSFFPFNGLFCYY